MTEQPLIERLLSGDQRALSRLISLIENGSDEVPSVIKQVYPRTGRARVIGFTGPPGAGKSSLIDRVTCLVRAEGLSAGIIVVDPSSPFSGGAVLGDRIRMQRHYLDEGVFIRSMATRGNPGGLPVACHDVVKLLDASGTDIILVETVGVGQTELDIMDIADTVVVVLVPESGDSIQAMKAGLLEIADIFVVNKADRPGAGNLMMDLRMVMEHGPKKPWWEVPVMEAQALHNVGINELWQCIKGHGDALRTSGQLDRKRERQRVNEFRRVLEQRVLDMVNGLIADKDRLSGALAAVERGADPYSAVEEVLSQPIILNPTPR